MPIYEFICGKCQYISGEMYRMNNVPKSQRCSQCKSGRMTRLFGSPNLKTSKTLKTFGQQAEKNAKEVGPEGMKFLDNNYKRAKYEAKKAAATKIASATGGKAVEMPKLYQDVDPALVKHVNKVTGL